VSAIEIQQAIAFSLMQQRQLAVPQEVSPCNLGGRGGGKSFLLYALAAQHAALYGPRAKILYLRRTYPSLVQPADNAQEVWHGMGAAHSFNVKDLRADFANGATCTFGPLETKEYFRQRWQGSSYSMLIHDELSSWATPELPDMSMSLLRAPGVITRYACATNPGPGSVWITPRYWRPSLSLPAGTPFRVPELGDRLCAVYRSTYKDNPNIPVEEALRGIAAGAAGNRALRIQYENGDFDSHVGLFFELSPSNFSDDWPVPFDWREFPHLRIIIGYDHGSRAPWSAHYIAKFRESGPGPDSRYYPKGSYVVFFEVHSADPENGYASAVQHCNVGDIAGEILKANAYLGLPDTTPIHADAAIFSNHGSLARSLGDEFKAYGLRNIVPAPKPRLRVTLSRLRELIANAGGEAVAGLFFVRRFVPYAVTAFSQAVADERDIEVLDPSYALDHAIDSVKSAIEASSSQGATVRTGPMFPTTSDQALIDHVERQARAALRERQRWATKAPPPDMVVRKPLFDAAAIDRLNARAAPTDAKPKSSPLQQSPIVRYK
jgi:hypothetical protein